MPGEHEAFIARSPLERGAVGRVFAVPLLGSELVAHGARRAQVVLEQVARRARGRVRAADLRQHAERLGVVYIRKDHKQKQGQHRTYEHSKTVQVNDSDADTPVEPYSGQSQSPSYKTTSPNNQADQEAIAFRVRFLITLMQNRREC